MEGNFKNPLLGAENSSKKDPPAKSVPPAAVQTASPETTVGHEVRTAILNNPETEKITRGVVNRLGRFLLGKCAKPRHDSQGGAEEECFLADDLRRPDATAKSLVSKFDKQIKAKVKELGLPTPTKLILIGYKTRQVSGTDYFIKLKASNSGQYFHVQVYASLQSDLILQDVAGPKLNNDKIEIPE